VLVHAKGLYAFFSKMENVQNQGRAAREKSNTNAVDKRDNKNDI